MTKEWVWIAYAEALLWDPWALGKLLFVLMPSKRCETMPKRSRSLLEEALQKLVLLVVVQVWLVDHLRRRDLAAPTAIVSKEDSLKFDCPQTRFKLETR